MAAGGGDERLDSLYRGQLEEFTAARNELAKQLRADGDSKAADRVKVLRKPTRAAWLVNQLAEGKPKDVESLLDAGRELRLMQEEMLAGSPDRDRLRSAARDEQRAVARLLKSAQAIGREHGVGPQVIDRVGETLRAAAGDSELADLIRAGRLDRERRASSLGLAGQGSSPPPRAGRRGDGGAAKRRARERQATRRKAAERAVRAAEKVVARESVAVEAAREKLEQREGRLADGERRLGSARRELDEIASDEH